MNVATVSLLLMVSLFEIEAAPFSQLKCFQFRYKLGQQQCEPKRGFKGDLVPCYNLCNQKLVKFEDCNKHPDNMHCCVHDCRCVMKGAGYVEIPQNYTLSLDDEKLSQWMKTEVEEGCEPENKFPISGKIIESESTKAILKDLTIQETDPVKSSVKAGPETTVASKTNAETTEQKEKKAPATKCIAKDHFVSQFARKMNGIFEQMGMRWEMGVEDGCN
uniref:uncharacterized protein LOC120347699 n=1 Tax=Styela clava TaxID=7725 RepID=UPI00193A7791|nr:uncharacterized protein LOC120347699 [Styela clava]XP_039273697.1 uncharacterized protein LOC120347699 [Styela clava]